MLLNLAIEDCATVLHIAGELDALSVVDLRPVIDKVREDRPTRVTVDLSHLRLIDSSGVGAIVALFKSVRDYGGALAVEGLRDQPLAIFRLLQLDRVLIRQAA